MVLPKDRWPGARYGMLFIIASGLYPSLCGIVAWNAHNLAGSWKRAIGMALQITIGNLGGAGESFPKLRPASLRTLEQRLSSPGLLDCPVHCSDKTLVGSNIYIKSEAPNYWTGYGVSLAVLVAAIVSGIVLRIGLNRINKKREKLTEEEVRSMYSADQLAEMGNQSPLFRCTL